MKNTFTTYIKDSVEEIRKVTWPTKNQAVRLTIIVLVFVLISSLSLAALDYAFNIGYEQLLKLTA